MSDIKKNVKADSKDQGDLVEDAAQRQLQQVQEGILQILNDAVSIMPPGLKKMMNEDDYGHELLGLLTETPYTRLPTGKRKLSIWANELTEAISTFGKYMHLDEQQLIEWSDWSYSLKPTMDSQLARLEEVPDSTSVSDGHEAQDKKIRRIEKLKAETAARVESVRLQAQIDKTMAEYAALEASQGTSQPAEGDKGMLRETGDLEQPKAVPERLVNGGVEISVQVEDLEKAMHEAPTPKIEDAENTLGIFDKLRIIQTQLKNSNFYDAGLSFQKMQAQFKNIHVGKENKDWLNSITESLDLVGDVIFEMSEAASIPTDDEQKNALRQGLGDVLDSIEYEASADLVRANEAKKLLGELLEMTMPDGTNKIPEGDDRSKLKGIVNVSMSELCRMLEDGSLESMQGVAGVKKELEKAKILTDKLAKLIENNEKSQKAWDSDVLSKAKEARDKLEKFDRGAE